MAEFTTEQVRDRFAGSFTNNVDGRGTDFDLWLAGVKEQAVVEAQSRVDAWFAATGRDIAWSGSDEDQEDLRVLNSAEEAVESILTDYRTEITTTTSAQ